MIDHGTSAAEVTSAILGERRYQEETWPSSRALTQGEELLLIEEYARRARELWTGEPGVAVESAQHMIRKIGAIAFRCLQTHGAVRREGF